MRQKHFESAKVFSPNSDVLNRIMQEMIRTSLFFTGKSGRTEGILSIGIDYREVVR